MVSKMPRFSDFFRFLGFRDLRFLGVLLDGRLGFKVFKGEFFGFQVFKVWVWGFNFWI